MALRIDSVASDYQHEVVIGVMGGSGTGKSSFIELLTGDISVNISHDRRSDTSHIQIVRFLDHASGRNVIIVEMPGFDESHEAVTDTDILKMIADFLLDEHDHGGKLNGLVYLERVSGTRFGGQTSRNLNMFLNICGKKTYKNVVVLTTFWDQITDEKERSKQEEELKSKLFHDLVKGDARFMRHDRTIESAHKVLRHILTLEATNVQIQEEICVDGKSLEDTAAGSVRQKELNQLIQAEYNKEVASLKAQLARKREGDEAGGRELEMRQALSQKKIAQWERELSVLKNGLNDERKVEEMLEQETATERKNYGVCDGANIRAMGTMDNPPRCEVDDHFAQDMILSSMRDKFRFAHSNEFPPYLKYIPREFQTNALRILNPKSLAQTLEILRMPPPVLLAQKRKIVPKTDDTLKTLVSRNRDLHTSSLKSHRPRFLRNMYFNENIGLRDDWYTDAVFGQQQFTGTNPTTITLAPRRWVDEFMTASDTQQRADVTRLLTDDPENIFVQDYSDFRSAMGAPQGAEFKSKGRHGCSSVALFHLEPEGKLHPLAITLDYKRSMHESVTIFNHRIKSTMPGEEPTDWPWRYAKMCAQVSDWLRHEIAVHLVNTHLVEEVIIVAAHRTIKPDHVVFKLLEPHWDPTLSLNKTARDILVPEIIIEIVGFTATQTYNFLKDAYNRFKWTDSYVPNDLRRRGFPIEDLDKPKYHNYGYARNIARMWEILRKFVCTILTNFYRVDAKVANDNCIAAFSREVRSDNGGQLACFPDIKTLDELIDCVTMCIHIASPQHTAVNYLQQYYQTFVPNRPSALYTRLPRSLRELQDYMEEDILLALPIREPRDWLIMAQVPYLLSLEVPDDNTILYYATQTSKSVTATDTISKEIRNAAKVLKRDLDAFGHTVSQYSQQLDDQQTGYVVLHPRKTAISILA